MRVVLYGATGRAGSRILHELLSRGHHVRAVTREAGSFDARENMEVSVDDLSEVSRTTEVIRGFDALISAYAAPPNDTDRLVAVTQLMVEAVRRSGIPRLMMVGGAGSLEVTPGVTLIKSGKLPSEWMPIAESHAKALQVLKSSTINWTSLCPAAYFDPGERTGRFHLGKDNLVANDKGESRISMEDYAIAMVDELEQPRHQRSRFSVGY
ncbi:MAG: NAD(P)-dependent oxidoreductase [Acidobacteriaceae bacterium]|nr:NAD(P)-dependent oxidoreductase [Acidobacteriaceae bacterium]